MNIPNGYEIRPQSNPETGESMGDGLWLPGDLQKGAVIGNYMHFAEKISRAEYLRQDDKQTEYCMVINNEYYLGDPERNFVCKINDPRGTGCVANVAVAENGDVVYGGDGTAGWAWLDYGDAYWDTIDFNRLGYRLERLPDDCYAEMDKVTNAKGNHGPHDNSSWTQSHWDRVFVQNDVYNDYHLQRNLSERRVFRTLKFAESVYEKLEARQGIALQPKMLRSMPVRNVRVPETLGADRMLSLPKVGSVKSDTRLGTVGLGTYRVRVPIEVEAGDSFDAPFAEQDVHKDITRQMFNEKLQTAIHSAIVTGKNAAKLRIHPPGGGSEVVDIPEYHMLFIHGRLSHAGVGYATQNTRLHCYIGDRQLNWSTQTREFFDQSDLSDKDASLSWFAKLCH